MDEFGQLSLRACVYCAVALHEECLRPTIVSEDGPEFICCCPRDDMVGWVEREAPTASRSKAEPKALGEITDVLSTGRKRAAMLYPIYPGMVCEWSGLEFAGGGVEPIVGCNGNLIYPTKDGSAGTVHHGPDKNTLNNHPANVHRICWSCHQTWHAKNNRYYGKRPSGDVPFLPKAEYTEHDPDTRADDLILGQVAAERVSVNPRCSDPHYRGVCPDQLRVAQADTPQI